MGWKPCKGVDRKFWVVGIWIFFSYFPKFYTHKGKKKKRVAHKWKNGTWTWGERRGKSEEGRAQFRKEFRWTRTQGRSGGDEEHWGAGCTARTSESCAPLIWFLRVFFFCFYAQLYFLRSVTVPLRSELRSLHSESRLLTFTTWNLQIT